MTTKIDRSRQAIIQQASDWFTRSRDTAFSDSDQLKLANWLRESPIHVEEYLAVAQLWGDIEVVKGIEDLPVSPVPDDDESNVQHVDFGIAQVEALDTQRTDTTHMSISERSGSRVWAVAASALLIVAISAGSLWYQWGSPDRHVTAIGEQRSIGLADGSVVEMNTASTIEVEFLDDVRRVSLLEGEAFFDVTDDVHRPFVVQTGEAEITVVGTKFNVYKKEAATTITVIEGNVAVAAEHGKSNAERSGGVPDLPIEESISPVFLEPGQQATIDNLDRQIRTVSLPDSEKFVAWTDRRLIFESTRLENILAEFARYNDIQYEFSDDGIAALELTGTFESQDFAALLDYLEYHSEVSVGRTGGIVIIGAAR